MRERQDSVFERDYVSTPTRETDIRPLVLASHLTKPYRAYRLSSICLIPASRSEGKFSARWYSLCTELHKFQDTRKNLVEIVVARLIQRRASFITTLYIYYIKNFLKSQIGDPKRRRSSFYGLRGHCSHQRKLWDQIKQDSTLTCTVSAHSTLAAG